MSQGTTALAYSNSPLLEEPTVGVGVIPAAESSPVANPLETGPPLSSEQHDMASMAQIMGPLCVAARRETFGLLERVLNTMAEARTPSTRRLYALNYSIFLTWCQDRYLDPVTSDVSVVLSFLQEMLDKQHSSFAIKVYAAAIAAFHAPIAGRSVGRDSAVIHFFFTRRQENESSACSYISTLGLTNRTKGSKGAPVLTIAIIEPQSTLVKKRPAVSTGVG